MNTNVGILRIFPGISQTAVSHNKYNIDIIEEYVNMILRSIVILNNLNITILGPLLSSVTNGGCGFTVIWIWQYS